MGCREILLRKGSFSRMARTSKAALMKTGKAAGVKLRQAPVARTGRAALVKTGKAAGVKKDAAVSERIARKEYRIKGGKVSETFKKNRRESFLTISTSYDDGGSARVEVLTQGRLIRKIYSEVKWHDGNIEDFLSPEDSSLLREALGVAPSREGQGKTELVHRFVEITDTGATPHMTTRLVDEKRYRQAAVLEVDSALRDFPTRLERFARDSSKEFISATTITATDSRGRTSVVKDFGLERILRGRLGDGGECEGIFLSSILQKNGKVVDRIVSHEFKGFNKETIARVSGISKKPDFLERLHRLKSPSVNYRDTTLTHTGKRGQHKTRMLQVGDYDKLLAVGHVIARKEAGDGVTWTYTRKGLTGRIIFSQVVTEGTDFSAVSATWKGEGHDYKAGITSTLDGQMVAQKYVERRLVDLVNEGLMGDERYVERFLAAVRGEAVYEEKFLIISVTNEKHEPDPAGAADISIVRRYRARNGKNVLTNVFRQDRNGSHNSVTTLQGSRPGSRDAVKDDVRKIEYAMDRAGRLMIMGAGLAGIPSHVEHEEGKEGVIPIETGLEAFSSLEHLYNGLREGGYAIMGSHPHLPESLEIVTGALALIEDTKGFVSALQEGDTWEVVHYGGSVASDVGGAMELAGEVASEGSEIAECLGVGSRILGVTGLVTGAVYGVYEILHGKALEGELDLAIDAGIAAAMFGAGWVPVVGWVIAGVGGLAKVALDIREARRAHRTQRLCI
jgi:hypothetical protein